MSQLIVEQCSTREREVLTDWLSQLERGLVYASPAFSNFVAATTGAEIVQLVARRNGKITGVLPFAVSTSGDGSSVINSLPWYGSHGGCWLQNEKDEESRRVLLQAYKDQIDERDPLFTTTIVSPWEESHLNSYREVLQHEVLDSRIGQILTLPQPGADLEETLAAKLKQKTRNLVRKSCKQGFEEVVGNHDASWDYLYETHFANMSALSGSPKPKAHFEALRSLFPGNGSRLSVAYLDGKPVAGLFLLKFAKTVEYLVPVISQEYRSKQPLSFLIWRAMLESANQGYRFWNWGGTWATQQSLLHFKMGWGSDEFPYSYLVSASDAGLSQFGEDPSTTMAKFPFFYLYPLSKIREPHSA